MHIEIQNCFSFWGTSSPRPPTGASPLDSTGGLLSPRPPAQDVRPHILYQVYAPGGERKHCCWWCGCVMAEGQTPHSEIHSRWSTPDTVPLRARQLPTSSARSVNSLPFSTCVLHLVPRLFLPHDALCSVRSAAHSRQVRTVDYKVRESQFKNIEICKSAKTFTF